MEKTEQKELLEVVMKILPTRIQRRAGERDVILAQLDSTVPMSGFEHKHEEIDRVLAVDRVNGLNSTIEFLTSSLHVARAALSNGHNYDVCRHLCGHYISAVSFLDAGVSKCMACPEGIKIKKLRER